jgi:cardiolipin synthase
MQMELLFHPSTLAWAGHATLVILLMGRVIMKRPATGVALAWLLLIATVPYVGAGLYLLIGERRISWGRAHTLETLQWDFTRIQAICDAQGLTDVDWSRHRPGDRALDTLGRALAGYPTVRGSRFEMFPDTDKALGAIARDIDAAERSVLIEFYIWNAGGLGDEVLEAVIRAANRKIACCLLIDALGARPWWKSSQPKRLQDAGVRLLPALPTGILRTFVGRTDLRLHRKIVVVDGSVAWTGSMNLVDPRYFKQDAGVGQWVDAMVRLQGSVVVPLAATFVGDWIAETNEPFAELVERTGLHIVRPTGDVDIQVIPSGPGQTTDGLIQMILALIHSAEHELVLTTPYLVPDESLLVALRGAAARGVKVRLIVPEKVDSFLARFASRSYYVDLLNVGIEVHLFRRGLLHTKAITVDQRTSMFGTANLDMRSFWLNYEVSLFVYDAGFCRDLRRLQQSYMDHSVRLDLASWNQRPFGRQVLENALRLASPLL